MKIGIIGAGNIGATLARKLVASGHDVNYLPPMSFLDTLPLNEIVREEVGTLRKFPEDWEEQMAAAGDDQSPSFHSQLT